MLALHMHSLHAPLATSRALCNFSAVQMCINNRHLGQITFGYNVSLQHRAGYILL